MARSVDRSRVIFGNEIAKPVVRTAERKKRAWLKRFGDDANADYPLAATLNPVLGKRFGLRNVISGDPSVEGHEPINAERGLVIGCIRMGYGHYRPALAIASAAKARGLIPYWFDFLSFGETTGAKVIRSLGELHSLGSRLSRKFPLFDKLYWEPLNSQGFKKLSFNSGDQKVSELMTPIFRNLDKSMPFVGTHPWNSQAAVHAGMKSVVNMIVDNWPMALHLAEGSIHTVQGPASWMGYRMLREFAGAKTALRMMPPGSLKLTGHIVDHELVANITPDCERRVARVNGGKARRLLLSVGGAGAQGEILAGIIKGLLQEIESGKIVLFINVGDHLKAWEKLVRDVPALEWAVKHFGDWNTTSEFCEKGLSGDVSGVHAFYDADVFAAVYTTNLLMRCSDVLVTKPGELSFYPIPKLFIRRIGGYEAWGAIRSAELGDGSIECGTEPLVSQALELLFREDELIPMMCDAIARQSSIGVYDGAYRVVGLATGKER